MNYFDFFELPEKLDIDLEVLKKKFYQNSKTYHPDFYTLATPEEQAEALEKASLNNEGYKVLIDFDKRLKYFLEIHEVLGQEGKNLVPQEFLMDMMDVNEKLMELEFEFDPEVFEKLQEEFRSTSKSLMEGVENLFDLEAKDLTEDQWVALKAYYLKNQYLNRLQENLQKVQEAK